MKNWIIGSLFLLISASNAKAEDSIQIKSYILKMQKYAVIEMNTHGVPASISLAQGILETNAGTSPLYTRSYNNFGIKCKSSWHGPFTYHDDDAKGECFRVYDNDSMSYADHSQFLLSASRYDFLFKLPKNDYKNWAYGLKKAGYATNTKYAVKLIEYIEKYQLSQFDNMDLASLETYANSNKKANQNAESSPVSSAKEITKSNNTISNLPAPPLNDGTNAAVDPDNIQIVHWNVTNVPDATNGYTTTPTKSRVYKRPVAKKAIAKKSTAIAKSPVKSKVNSVAKSSNKKPNVAIVKAPIKKGATAKATAANVSKNNRSTRL